MMEAGPMVGVIITLCAIILAGRSLASRQLPAHRLLGLGAMWLAIILAGVVIASLWLTHQQS